MERIDYFYDNYFFLFFSVARSTPVLSVSQYDTLGFYVDMDDYSKFMQYTSHNSSSIRKII